MSEEWISHFFALRIIGVKRGRSGMGPIDAIRKNKKLLIGTILLSVVIAVIIHRFLYPTIDGWISFLGGYVGGIVTLVAVIISTTQTASNFKKETDWSVKREKEKICDQIIDYTSDFCVAISRFYYDCHSEDFQKQLHADRSEGYRNKNLLLMKLKVLKNESNSKRVERVEGLLRICYNCEFIPNENNKFGREIDRLRAEVDVFLHEFLNG